ncbi:MAG: TauD/TfdA family dioxygenase [Pseudomonadota bacterium]
MAHEVNTGKLILASQREWTTFKNIPSNPIEVNDVKEIPLPVIHELIDRYHKHGFAILDIKPGYIVINIVETINIISRLLELGNPFIPPLYQQGNYKAGVISKISVDNKSQKNPSHPSFHKTRGLKLHSDGTLQKIGYVKTSMLYCKSPGLTGGDSTFFNASGAFAALVYKNLSAAIALMHPRVFIRQANVNGCDDINRGPTFTIKNGEIFSAYSVTETDRWENVKGVNRDDLARGINFLDLLARPNSPYFYQFKLTTNQLLILANTKIAHGRIPYTDSPRDRRCLYRSLFLKQPKFSIDMHFEHAFIPVC